MCALTRTNEKRNLLSKKVVCSKLTVAIKLQYETKTAESFRNCTRMEKIEKEKRKGPREKSAMTSTTEKVVGQRRRGPRYGCSEVNQKSCRIRRRREQLD